MATDTLVRYLGLTPEIAMARLSEAPSVLAEAMEAEAARNLSELLRSLGLRVRLDDMDRDERLRDVSIQLTVPVRMKRAVRVLAELTDLSEDEVALRLRGPGGIILTGLSGAETERLRAGTARLGNITFIESDPGSATYDIFLRDGEAGEGLTDRLRMMGAEPDPITGALAAGLDRALCRHLKSRVDRSDLLILDRNFQRYDLYLTRATGWMTRDLADFLVARTGLPRSRFEILSDELPLRIELGLTHAVSRQFRADYASIGLHTFLLLSGLSDSAYPAAV